MAYNIIYLLAVIEINATLFLTFTTTFITTLFFNFINWNLILFFDMHQILLRFSGYMSSVLWILQIINDLINILRWNFNEFLFIFLSLQIN